MGGLIITNNKTEPEKKGFPRPYLLAVASLLVFGSYGVKDGDNVGWAFCKVGRAGNGGLVDVHGVRVLEDGEAERYVAEEAEKKV